jgi:putative ABC transport system substrate-binding protein
MKRREFMLALGGVALFLTSPSHAQTGKVYRIGFLSPGDFAPGTNPSRMTEEISRQLAQRGFTTGANLELIKRGAEGHFERLPALVAELVAAKVDVIVTFS